MHPRSLVYGLFALSWICLAQARVIPVSPLAGEASATAISSALTMARPGDRVVLAPGIYRESLTVAQSGTQAAPLIIESADPAKPAILSGADAITTWKPLADSGLEEAGHPASAHVFYADVDWVPTQLFVGAEQQRIARTPNAGWWPAESDGKTVRSASLAELPEGPIEGAQLFFVLMKTVRQELASVQGWTRDGPLVLSAPLFKGEAAPFGRGDRFCLQNHVAFLDQPGEWVAKKTASGARLFFWPSSAEALTRTEAPRRDCVVTLASASHVTFRGLHIRHASVSSAGFGLGVKRAGEASVAAPSGIVVEDCAIYQNGRFGVAFNGLSDSALRRSLVVDNSYGVSVSGSLAILIEECQIAWNENDGVVVTWGSRDVTLRRNAIHHHSRFAHPDNFQSYRDVKGVTLDSNVIIAAGQGVHTQETEGLVARNNVFAGSSANLFFTGKGGTTNGYVLERNTFALYPEVGIILDGQGHFLTGNLFDIRSGKNGYSGKARPKSFNSTNNLFSLTGNPKAGLATFTAGGFTSYRDLATIQADTGWEVGSSLGETGFASAPLGTGRLDPNRIGECTVSRLVLDPRDGSKLKKGDHLEYDFDGVDRIVTEAAAGTLTISPALREPPVMSVTVLNWGDRPVSALDLRSKSGLGSTVDVEAFLAGDFNGDGRRDIPAWPAGIQSPRVLQAPQQN